MGNRMCLFTTKGVVNLLGDARKKPLRRERERGAIKTSPAVERWPKANLKGSRNCHRCLGPHQRRPPATWLAQGIVITACRKRGKRQKGKKNKKRGIRLYFKAGQLVLAELRPDVPYVARGRSSTRRRRKTVGRVSCRPADMSGYRR